MSKYPIDEVLEDISTAGHGCVAVSIGGIVYVTFHLTPFADKDDDKTRSLQAHSAVDSVVSKYSDRPLLLMGDTNNLSPEDKDRYADEAAICRDSGINYCTSSGHIDYDPIQTLLDGGLNDLCWFTFNTASTDNQREAYNQCSNSCPTSIWDNDIGKNNAKIDYIFGNDAFLEAYGVLHSRVQVNANTDWASDHYPIELMFAKKLQ